MFSDQFWLFFEYFAVITGFVYLYLEIKQKPQMWLVGGICSILYVIIFAFSRIYADMAFNIYNAIISFYGFQAWRKSLLSGKLKESDRIEYTHLTLQQALQITSVTILIYGLIYTSLKLFTDSPIPAGDAFTTTLSIVATWMLAQRIIEHWLFWVVVNVVSIYLYFLRELYPTMLLYAFYAGAAVMGYYLWKKNGLNYAKQRI